MKENKTNNTMLSIDGLNLVMESLHTKQELIDYLTENGPTHSALMDFCDEYRDKYGNELCWSYPISDGKHLGTFLVLVQEGILSLPYDNANQEDYEIFCMEDARMFTADALDEFISDWNRFSENLHAAMVSMRNFLAQTIDRSSSVTQLEKNKEISERTSDNEVRDDN